MSIDTIMADLAQYIRMQDEAAALLLFDPPHRMWYNRYVKGVPDCYLSCC